MLELDKMIVFPTITMRRPAGRLSSVITPGTHQVIGEILAEVACGSVVLVVVQHANTLEDPQHTTVQPVAVHLEIMFSRGLWWPVGLGGDNLQGSVKIR